MEIVVDRVQQALGSKRLRHLSAFPPATPILLRAARGLNQESVGKVRLQKCLKD